MSGRSVKRTFRALGGTVIIRAGGDGAAADVVRAEKAIRNLHRRLTRFEETSELSRLNADPRFEVPASPVMIRFAEAVRHAGLLSHGLVDATLLDAIERAGYTDSIDPASFEPGAGAIAASSGTGRKPGGPSAARHWDAVGVDHEAESVLRPPGVKLDSGGIGKGLAADIGAELLAHLEYFAVECSGDLRFGNQANRAREIFVASPFNGERPVGKFSCANGAVATSGTTRRSWVNPDGRPSHHLIDPRTGEPSNTGVTQVTAVAPTAVEAEVRAKAALLAGPDDAPDWLTHGGVIVLDDDEVVTIAGRTGSEAAA